MLQDYYPFGMAMPGRTSNSPDYRYGFNGKEKDEGGEFGNLTAYDYGFRIYNPGIGRFLSVDPLTSTYPMLTPYQFASNSPIWAIDLDGLEAAPTNDGDKEGQEDTRMSRTQEAESKTWVWHTGNEALGTEAGWLSKDDYIDQVVEGIAGAHGAYDGANFNMDNSDDNDEEFDTSPYDIGIDDNWISKYSSYYAMEYEKAAGAVARKGVGVVENSYPLFDIISGGFAHFGRKLLAKTFARQLVVGSLSKIPAGSVKITVATMKKSGQNSYFGHTVIGIGNKYYHQVAGGKPVLKLISGEAEMVRYGIFKEGTEYSVQTFTVSGDAAALAHKYINSTINKKQVYNVVCNNCVTNGVSVLEQMGLKIPASVRTPKQLENYIIKLKESGVLNE